MGTCSKLDLIGVLGNNDILIWHDVGHDTEDVEAEVEEDPLNVGAVGVDVLADDLVTEGGHELAEDEVVNVRALE